MENSRVSRPRYIYSGVYIFLKNHPPPILKIMFYPPEQIFFLSILLLLTEFGGGGNFPFEILLIPRDLQKYPPPYAPQIFMILKPDVVDL